MTKKELIAFNFLKNITMYDVIFYLSFLISIIVSITMEKKHLVYVIPIVLFTILLNYISVVKTKVKPLFIFVLLADLVSTSLAFLNFTDFFMWISIATSTYLICCTFILKTYLNKSNLKSILSLSVCIGFLLISYILYAVLELLIDYIPENMLFFALLCTLCLIIYTITFAMLYINDNYSNATILLASGIFAFCQVSLSPINELFLSNNTFTVLIIICNILSFHLFMKFIASTNYINAKDVKEKYI